MSSLLLDQANNGVQSSNLLAWRSLYLSKAKLKATSRTSALLSGFAMIGMVEVSINEDINGVLLIVYAINTTLLVAVHLLALMISTCILPNIESVSATMSSIQESPHKSMHCYIEMAWAFSTGLGILLFLAEIAILCWVKFGFFREHGRYAAIVSTAIIAPAGIVFIVFALHFYRKLADHKYSRTARNLEELENIHSGLTQI